MGHLLGLIVAERNRPVTGLMISALVIYLDGNDAGTGFYKLAQDLGELPPGTLSAHVKEQFWVSQLKKYMPTTKSTAVNQPGNFSASAAGPCPVSSLRC